MVSSIVVICYTFQIEAGNYPGYVTVHTFYTIGPLKGFCWSLSIALFIHSHKWLCSWCWGDCIKFGWEQFECTSWSFTVHFGVDMYSFSLANESLYFPFKSPQLFDCGYRVHFNFHLFYIFKFVFSFGGGGSPSFPLVLEVNLCLLLVACVSFFGGRICCFLFSWVFLGIYFY